MDKATEQKLVIVGFFCLVGCLVLSMGAVVALAILRDGPFTPLAVDVLRDVALTCLVAITGLLGLRTWQGGSLIPQVVRQDTPTSSIGPGGQSGVSGG